jgi:hypothetical protein
MKNGSRVLTGDDIDERLLNFSARAGKVVDALPNTQFPTSVTHIAASAAR